MTLTPGNSNKIALSNTASLFEILLHTKCKFLKMIHQMPIHDWSMCKGGAVCRDFPFSIYHDSSLLLLSHFNLICTQNWNGEKCIYTSFKWNSKQIFLKEKSKEKSLCLMSYCWTVAWMSLGFQKYTIAIPFLQESGNQSNAAWETLCVFTWDSKVCFWMCYNTLKITLARCFGLMSCVNMHWDFFPIPCQSML